MLCHTDGAYDQSKIAWGKAMTDSGLQQYPLKK